LLFIIFLLLCNYYDKPPHIKIPVYGTVGG